MVEAATTLAGRQRIRPEPMDFQDFLGLIGRKGPLYRLEDALYPLYVGQPMDVLAVDAAFLFDAEKPVDVDGLGIFYEGTLQLVSILEDTDETGNEHLTVKASIYADERVEFAVDGRRSEYRMLSDFLDVNRIRAAKGALEGNARRLLADFARFGAPDYKKPAFSFSLEPGLIDIVNSKGFVCGIEVHLSGNHRPHLETASSLFGKEPVKSFSLGISPEGEAAGYEPRRGQEATKTDRIVLPTDYRALYHALSGVLAINPTPTDIL